MVWESRQTIFEKIHGETGPMVRILPHGINTTNPRRMLLRGFRVVPPRIELGTQGFSVLCSTNWAMAPSIFPYLKFGEVPFFSFGITKVGIFSYTPNFSCTFFNIFSKFFHAYTITHYPSGNCPETLFLTFFCHHQTQICNLKTILSNINPNNEK